MKLRQRSYLLLILCVLLGYTAQAQSFSYVYIQGDKQTPFYVKMDGEMLPRYGKNYSIISQLAPGPIEIEVLFQQNVYPSQKFTIGVPENGYRGFLLSQKGGSFSLYDIQQRFYLQANNRLEDDHPPVNNPATAYVPTKPQEPLVANNTNVAKPTARKKTTVPPPPAPGEPQFIDNVELNNEHTVQNENVLPTGTQVVKPAVAIVNSDCPAAMDNFDYEDLYKKATGKSEKIRLKYLLSQMEQCYTTYQVRLLAQTLPNDPEKYTFLKSVYSRVTDQAVFPGLESLLSSEEWKSYFRLILP